MFYNCWKITVAPEISATTVMTDGCASMFANCTGLTTPPSILPAMSFPDSWEAYGWMFENCWSLTSAPMLPANNVNRLTYSGMFANCTGLTTAPVLSAMTVQASAYTNMFSNCISLTDAPVLPASGLSEYCYYEMFKGCSQLSSITMNATTNLGATNALTNWVRDVSPTGVFVKQENTVLPSGNNGIPEGWVAYSDNIILTPTTIECGLTGKTVSVTATSLNSWTANTSNE